MKKIRTVLLTATLVFGLSGALTAAAAQRSFDPEQMADLEGAVWKEGDVIRAEDCAFILSYQYENTEGTEEGMDRLEASIASYAQSIGYASLMEDPANGKYYAAQNESGISVIVLGEEPFENAGGRRFSHSYTIWQAQEGSDGWRVSLVEEQESYTAGGEEHPCYYIVVSPDFEKSEPETAHKSTSAKAAACDHVYEYVMEKEPLENEDGILAKKCEKCGAIAEYRPVSAIMAFLQNAEKAVKNAAQGATVTVETDRWLCFDRAVMEAIAARPDVTVTVNYRYQHKDYTVTIPAGYDVKGLLNEEGFCGFRYLDLMLGGEELAQ